MKKLILSSAIGAVLFSCSTSNKVVNSNFFQKRKYNKGYYFDVAKKSNESKPTALKQVNHSISDEILSNKIVEFNNSATINSNDVNILPSSEIALNNSNDQPQNTFSNIVISKSESNFIKNQSKSSKSIIAKSIKKDKKVASGDFLDKDAKTYLKYALICLGIAIIFWILGVATLIWPLLWVSWFAGILAALFFVLWLIKEFA